MKEVSKVRSYAVKMLFLMSKHSTFSSQFMMSGTFHNIMPLKFGKRPGKRKSTIETINHSNRKQVLSYSLFGWFSFFFLFWDMGPGHLLSRRAIRLGKRKSTIETINHSNRNKWEPQNREKNENQPRREEDNTCFTIYWFINNTRMYGYPNFLPSRFFAIS